MTRRRGTTTPLPELVSPALRSFRRFARLANGVFAGQNGARSDGQARRRHVAFDFSFGTHQHRTAADDVAFDLASYDQTVTEDVGDDIPLFLDRDDAADFNRSAGFVLRDALVFEAKGFAAELAGDRHRLSADLLRLVAVEADDSRAIIRLRDVVFGSGHAFEL